MLKEILQFTAKDCDDMMATYLENIDLQMDKLKDKQEIGGLKALVEFHEMKFAQLTDEIDAQKKYIANLEKLVNNQKEEIKFFNSYFDFPLAPSV